MDGVANLVAKCLALDERPIFQSVSKNTLLQLNTKAGTLSRVTIGLAR